FLDAILVGTYMKRPVHFLTRSDVFRYKLVRYFLHQLKMIPVYRIRDGKDKLHLNDSSFRRSVDALKKGEHVLIFVEGFCAYQTTLQPLKKGAARILLQSWREGAAARMLPLWIRYDSFWKFGKKIELIPGAPFGAEQLDLAATDGAVLQQINRLTATQLEELSTQQAPPPRRPAVLVPFAMAGFLLHAPLYYLYQPWVYRLMRHTIHYDSLLFCLLAISYPFWLLLVGFLAWQTLHSPLAVLVPLGMPLFLKSLMLVKQ
ncbi:MAG TPA: 1-acyl-sn-glycerol-3-phosphate acyltransferase, partial [Lacibacter sp.]|nr:1-acyl-sn-glycerol-3-phosphate acyltransferase [Lacibacter sp.]